MTDATTALAGMAELAEKGPDVDMLRQMVHRRVAVRRRQ